MLTAVQNNLIHAQSADAINMPSSYGSYGDGYGAASNYNTLYDSANEHSVVAPGNRAEASRASGSAAASSPSKHKRLASLDVVRGFTIALMIFVDELGDAFPSINHSPWYNITLADFVMPWFLFMVGTSAAFSLRKFQTDRQSRLRGTKYVAMRALKLYLLGVMLQGGGWFGSYSYGYNLSTIRWCGILNRIGFAYFVVGLMELWLPVNGGEGKDVSARCCRQKHHGCYFFRVHAWKWALASFFVLLHIVISFGMYVPSWESEWGWNATVGDSVKLDKPFTIECNLRGWETMKNPACSATGYFDRALFGQDHLGMWMSRRGPECSSCSPGDPNGYFRPGCHYIEPVVPGPNSTEPDTRWCFAHIYDPEGLPGHRAHCHERVPWDPLWARCQISRGVRNAAPRADPLERSVGCAHHRRSFRACHDVADE